jgi:hypothetical protein
MQICNKNEVMFHNIPKFKGTQPFLLRGRNKTFLYYCNCIHAPYVRDKYNLQTTFLYKCKCKCKCNCFVFSVPSTISLIQYFYII